MTTVAHRSRPVAGPAKWFGLVGFGVASAVAAGIGGLGVAGTADKYQDLAQPGWAPPSWLFGPVWTVLYGLIAVSGWLVWTRVGWGRALAVFAVQLVLNALWTPLFFGAGQVWWALVDIVALWLAIGATIALFGKVSRLAAWLLLPYWAWVSFATALNLSIALMN